MNALKKAAAFLPVSVREPLRNLYRGMKGAPDFNLLRMMSDPSKIALDIGANAGAYAKHMANYSKRVEAFEPVPELAEYIRTKYRKLPINVRACALSDTTGIVTLRIPIIENGENPANASVEPGDLSVGTRTRDINVRCYRIDDLNLEPVGVIKLDAEGHESSILRGALDRKGQTKRPDGGRRRSTPTRLCGRGKIVLRCRRVYRPLFTWSPSRTYR
jgi:FkbM family methyltransferase